jgi:hypothetical protein
MALTSAANGHLDLVPSGRLPRADRNHSTWSFTTKQTVGKVDGSIDALRRIIQNVSEPLYTELETVGGGLLHGASCSRLWRLRQGVSPEPSSDINSDWRWHVRGRRSRCFQDSDVSFRAGHTRPPPRRTQTFRTPQSRVALIVSRLQRRRYRTLWYIEHCAHATPAASNPDLPHPSIARGTHRLTAAKASIPHALVHRALCARDPRRVEPRPSAPLNCAWHSSSDGCKGVDTARSGTSSIVHTRPPPRRTQTFRTPQLRVALIV